MNIWIFNHYAITPNLPGGTRHFDFAKELIKRGYKVTIFTSSFHYSLFRETKEYNKRIYLEEDYEGVKFIWIKTFPYKGNDWRRVLNMLSYSIRVYNVAKKLDIEKPNIIIGSSVHLFAVFSAYLLAKYFKVSFIMEVRDLWPQTLINMGVPKWNPFVIILSILERFLYKRARKIITLLPKASDYITSLGVSGDKIVWIPNGVDLERFNLVEASKEDKDQNFTVLYMGAIGKANNLDVAIKSAEILQNEYPNIRFLFVGDGVEKSRLIKIVKEKRLNNVEFRGPVPKKDVIKIISKSDTLLILLRNLNLYKYGISLNKLFDYLASGKPIIFSSNSINNPVEEANAGITVPPDDPVELAKAIVKLYKMPKEERQKIGENGRRYVERYYAIPVLVDKLEKVIKDVISEESKTKTHN